MLYIVYNLDEGQPSSDSSTTCWY